MNDDRYKEAGTVYRYFLGWRHASFAGNLIVISVPHSRTYVTVFSADVGPNVTSQ